LFGFGRIDISFQHLPPYPIPDASGSLPDSRPRANSLLDGRAAAAVSASVGDPWSTELDLNAFLELNDYNGQATPPIPIPSGNCLAAMAYADYFQDSPNGDALRRVVSEAIMSASPGFCGSFGPGVTGAFSLEASEGNYDMTEMWLLPLAYCYYEELIPEARERLITQLLARGIIHRPREDDTFTSGGAPNDWSRAGFVSPGGIHVDIPETENHVLMIATARYLTNQLLYQRDQNPSQDNRRNGCMDQLLGLLRDQLRNDFAEYNAKNYQEETRHALLNLCSYAYDAEVRLGARMVLDYISAHIAVSSNDLRRLVPYRRRNEELNVHQIPGQPGFMDVALLDSFPGSSDAPKQGGDPIGAHFALLAGNTRGYRFPTTAWPGNTSTPARKWSWAITPNFGADLILEALSDYRLPPSVHDLFVNDLHRRFFQRLHRHKLLQEPGQQRNCDNMEIYASSASYLITAGGQPATWVIPYYNLFGHPLGGPDQNLGVAMPTSFMPTGLSAGIDVSPNDARSLIQFLHFSDKPGETENLGVAPDFMCGFQFHFPPWTGVPKDQDGTFFAQSRGTNSLRQFASLLGFSSPPISVKGDIAHKLAVSVPISLRELLAEPAGFYLAIIKQHDFVLLEAFDTWLHPEVTFEQFQNHVTTDNADIQFKSNEEMVYTTFNGNRIHFVIWNAGERDNHTMGSKILHIEYGDGDPADTLADAGNDTDSFLSGTILKSPADGLVEIHNPFLGTKITLNWSDPSHLVRIAESGEVEEAGKNHEVWVDFSWTGPSEGDFFRPFNTIAAAVGKVADGGVIKIMPGTTAERPTIHKRVRLVASSGGVSIGAS
jgi:hypothetical protein